jgi:hypothetical protein
MGAQPSSERKPITWARGSLSCRSRSAGPPLGGPASAPPPRSGCGPPGIPATHDIAARVRRVCLRRVHQPGPPREEHQVPDPGPGSVRRPAKFVRRHIRHRRGLTGRVGRFPRGPDGLSSRGACSQGGRKGLSHRDLAPPRGARPLNRLARTFVRGLPPVEGVEYAPGAMGRPQGKKLMVGVPQGAAAAHGDEPGVPALGEDHVSGRSLPYLPNDGVGSGPIAASWRPSEEESCCEGFILAARTMPCGGPRRALRGAADNAVQRCYGPIGQMVLAPPTPRP